VENSKQFEHVKSLEENKYGANNQILNEPKSLYKNKWDVKRKDWHSLNVKKWCVE